MICKKIATPGDLVGRLRYSPPISKYLQIKYFMPRSKKIVVNMNTLYRGTIKAFVNMNIL